MPRLSISSRNRIVSLYYQNELSYVKGRYKILKELASEENICVEEQAIRKLMNKWFKTRSVADLPKVNGKTKITEIQLKRLDKAVYKERSLTARKLKNMFNLNVSHCTIRRYLNALGWKKIRSKYCQVVSLKNRRERIAFANSSLAFKDRFLNSIFIDESSIQATKNASKIWNKKFLNETRLGLIEKYAHLETVHVIGGISRKGPTPLIIFKSIKLEFNLIFIFLIQRSNFDRNYE